MTRRITATLFCLMAIACGDPVADIRIHPDSSFQTIVGWESHTESGEVEVPSFLLYRERLFDRAVSELGLTRLRLQAYSGMENPDDLFPAFSRGDIGYDVWRCKRFEAINDDEDPRHIDWRGFQFTQLDSTVEAVVLPIRRRLAKSENELYLNVNYNAFVKRCPGTPYHHLDDPAEYAEFALAVFTHLRDRWGLVPDAWELVLEPDNTDWTGRAMGEALVHTARLLEEHGFEPDFIGPSTADLAKSIEYLEEIATVPGAIELLDELSYHRYRGVTRDSLRIIAAVAERFGLRTAMLEHIGSGHEDLYDDLTLANVSAWQQFALAYGGGGDGSGADRGGVYYRVLHADSDTPRIRMADRTPYLAQYFRFVRPGARRIGATSDRVGIDPVAFVNPDGRVTVVINASSAATLRLPDLPPGRYSFTWTTAEEFGVRSDTVRILQGDTLTARMPAAGVITVHPG